MDVLDLLLQHYPVPIVDYDLPPLAANVEEEEQQEQEEEVGDGDGYGGGEV